MHLIISKSACSSTVFLSTSIPYNTLTVDTDYIQVNYMDVFELMEHLQNMAENKAAFSTTGTSRETFMAMASTYQEMYGNPDGTIPATFQVERYTED